MPPEIKTNRKKMLDGVISIINERGFDGVSARSVAERLGISTQPIYREFGDMDGLRRAAAEYGWEIFARYINGEAIEQSVRYITFAAERSNLFNFLFRSEQCEYDGLDDLSHKLVDGTQIIERLQNITGLPRERMYRVHLYIWMAIHGLAAMSADNRLSLTDAEIKEFTMNMTKALIAFFGDGKK